MPVSATNIPQSDSDRSRYASEDDEGIGGDDEKPSLDAANIITITASSPLLIIITTTSVHINTTTVKVQSIATCHSMIHSTVIHCLRRLTFYGSGSPAFNRSLIFSNLLNLVHCYATVHRILSCCHNCTCLLSVTLVSPAKTNPFHHLEAP